MKHHTTRQRVGLALAGLLSLNALPSVLSPTPDGQVGAPTAVLVLSSVLGGIGVVATVVAWLRGSTAAMRVLAGSIVVNALAGVPAFFVEIPAWVKLMVGVSVLLTLIAVALMFAPGRPTTAASELTS